MIDPRNIVREYSDVELEELIIFCICVAGKTAKTIAPRVGRLVTLAEVSNLSLFDYIRQLHHSALASILGNLGIGCYTSKALTMKLLVKKWWSGAEIREAIPEDLEEIKGIGPKTSRFFVMCHKGGNYAALDTHVLKYLRAQGFEVPKSTPNGKRYKEIEQQFLSLVPKGMTPAEFDLEIWNKYAKS